MITLYLAVIAVAIAGLTQLYAVCIQPRQIFDFMQKALVYFKDKNTFLFKRLGGCAVCNLQLFVDLTALILIRIFYIEYAWWQMLLMYFLLTGLTFYFYAIAESLKNRPQQERKIEHENLNL